MTCATDDGIRELLVAAGQAMGRHFEAEDPDGIELISRPKSDAENSVGVFAVRARPRRDDSVLILSDARHPDSVEEAVARTSRIADALPPHLAKTLLRPEYHGRHDGRSFAIYPRLGTLSRNRVIRFAQKRLIRDSILDWTLEVAGCSRQPVDDPGKLDTRFIAPLAHLAQETGASESLRRAAAEAAERMQDPGFVPVSIAQHGDFWHENILLNRGWPARRGQRFAFSVIDWGAADPAGYPFIDFLVYGLSSTRDMAWITSGLRAQRERLDLPPEAILPHVCAGMGWVGMHLGLFPYRRYLEMAETLSAGARRLAA